MAYETPVTDFFLGTGKPKKEEAPSAEPAPPTKKPKKVKQPKQRPGEVSR